MIVSEIDMWPMGFEDQHYSLGRIVVVNDGTGGYVTASYDVIFFSRDGIQHVKLKDATRGHIFEIIRAGLNALSDGDWDSEVPDYILKAKPDLVERMASEWPV